VATHRIPVLGWAARPDDTGECFFEPYDLLATNDVWDRLVGRFGSNNAAQPTVRHGVHGGFTVPKNYVGSPALIVVWSSTLTSGNVVWDFEYRAVGGDDAESLDQAGTQESVTVTDGAPSAAHERMEASLSLTAGNFAVDDMVQFYFARDGADGSDTLAGSALLFDLLFQYADV
jgi:hypothetical protein